MSSVQIGYPLFYGFVLELEYRTVLETVVWVVRLPPKLLMVRKPKTRGRSLQNCSYLVEVQAAPPLLGRSFNGRKSRLHRDNGSSILPRSTIYNEG